MEKIQTLVSSFVDYEGNEHKFILAAVSVKEDEHASVMTYEDEYDDWGDEIKTPKSVRLGIAICHPGDNWDEELGYKMAVGRAKSNPNYALYATRSGMINTGVVTALLNQEAEYIKNNPAQVITGYKEAKKKYEEHLIKEQLFDELTEEEQDMIEFLRESDPKQRDLYDYLINE